MAIVTGRPPTNLTIRRDRSMLLLGWAAALRESELVALNVDDLTFTGDPDRGHGRVLIRLSTRNPAAPRLQDYIRGPTVDVR